MNQRNTRKASEGPVELNSISRTFTLTAPKQVSFLNNRGVIRKNNVEAKTWLELWLKGGDLDLAISSASATPHGELTCYVAASLYLQPGTYTYILRWMSNTGTNIDGPDLYIEPEVQHPTDSPFSVALKLRGKGGTQFGAIRMKTATGFGVESTYESSNNTFSADFTLRLEKQYGPNHGGLIESKTEERLGIHPIVIKKSGIPWAHDTDDTYPIKTIAFIHAVGRNTSGSDARDLATNIILTDQPG